MLHSSITEFRKHSTSRKFHPERIGIGKFAFVASFLFALSLQAQTLGGQRVVVGAERLELLLPMLEGKEVALVVNQTSLVGGRHLADTLQSLGVCISVIFAPEHGFRGDADAGEHIQDGYDLRTGAAIVSLYGKRRKPIPEDLAGADVVIFDIQDVGARFYTFISTLFYVLEACAEQDKEAIVLDRPNPNGHLVDGPVLDSRLTSFVGIAPIPIAHGCTVGELARLFVGEFWIYKPESLRLRVVPCLHYTHSTPYDVPVPPSPNLPTARAVLLYPSLCLFEGSTCSVGRGTDWPFEVVGHPDFFCDSFNFVPRPNAGNKYPLHAGWLCGGWDFGKVSVDSLRAARQLNLNWLIQFYQRFPNKPAFFREDNFFDLLAGTRNLRQQILEGKTEAEIRATWEEDLAAYRAIRQKHLLYAE
ncbi:MAG: exo-beta-N-acetylmuramidase NamZ domain-containing protein [Saprospiraceae bacterium]